MCVCLTSGREEGGVRERERERNEDYDDFNITVKRVVGRLEDLTKKGKCFFSDSKVKRILKVSKPHFSIFEIPHLRDNLSVIVTSN